MQSVLAKLFLSILIRSVLAIRLVRKQFWPSPEQKNRTLMVIGNFYNKGWFEAHTRPLSRSLAIEKIIVVCDEEIDIDIPGLEFWCPSHRLKRLLGRGIARLIVLFRAARAERPSVYMGYHVMPNAPLAVLAASLWGGEASIK